MLALVLELTVVLAWFAWAYRRQQMGRRKGKPPVVDQLPLPFEKMRKK
jgi:hypothetical protein